MSACLERRAPSRRRFERADLVDRQIVEIALAAGKDHRDFFFRLQRRELRLLQQFGEAGAAVEQALRGGIEVGTELREGRHFAILRQLALERAGNLLHRLDLGVTAHAGHRDTDVHRRTDALEEQVGLEEDLAVGDRNHVGRNVGRHVVGLGLDDGERGERTKTVVFVELGGALEQARVQVEHVARIGFAARRTAQQQRHLAVGDGLLGEIVIGDHGMHAVVAEELADGGAGHRREELHRRRIGSGGRDHDRIFERAIVLEDLDELRHGRALLADGDVDAVELVAFRGAGGMRRLLVEEGVENDGGLAGLAIADDQLALAAADRDQRVDGLEAGRHRLMHRFARQDARRLHVDAATLGELDRALAIDRIAQRVDDAAEQALADGGIDDRAGPLDGVAFLDAAVVAEDHDADIVGFEVQRHALDAARELDELTGLHIVEAIDAGDAVADAEHLADFGNFGFLAEILDLVLEDRRNFRGFDVHYPTSFIAIFIAWSLVLRELSIICEPTLTTRPPIRRRIDMFGECNGLADLGLQRIGESLELRGRQGRRRRHFRTDFAAFGGDKPIERLDDGGQREQAAVAGDHLDEIGNCGAGLGLGEDDVDRIGLGIGADHRRAEEATEIVAVIRQFLDRREARFDGVDSAFGFGEIKERRRIWLRDLGQHRILLSQSRSIPVAGRALKPGIVEPAARLA